MSNPFVSGLFGAWTTVQIALGAFFLQAYAARRREFEYLLFALVCFALAVTDAGLTLHSYIVDLSDWYIPAVLTHVGAFVATATNIHFVLTLISKRAPRRYVVPAYVYSAVCTLLFLGGYWWEEGSLHRSHREFMGLPYDQMLARPTMFGILGYAGIMASDLAALAVLYVAYFRGKRDLRGARLA